jgi:hypothetical protein
MNELLWIFFVFLDLSMVLVVFRLFGRPGLFGLIVFNLILCNIQVLKTVELFGLTATLGNVLYGSVFLSTDLLSEFYGKEQARKGVFLGFAMLLLTTVYMQLALLFVPAAGDFAHEHLQVIFGFLPRVALASMAAYLVSQLHDVWAFHFVRQRTGGRHLWLRNNASTLVSQLLDSLIFCLIAFLGVFPMAVWWEILLTTYVIKALVAVLDTPFIYAARRLFPAAAARAGQPSR